MIAWTCIVCRKIAEWADRLDDKAICPDCLKKKIEDTAVVATCETRGYHIVKKINPGAKEIELICQCGATVWIAFTHALHPIESLVGRHWTFAAPFALL